MHYLKYRKARVFRLVLINRDMKEIQITKENIRQINWALNIPSSSSRAKMILAHLICMADENGLVSITYRELSDGIKANKRTVMNAVEHLEDRGFIEVERHRNRKLPHTYKVHENGRCSSE